MARPDRMGSSRFRMSRIVLYSLIVWAPLPLGSNRPLFWAINGAAACVAFGIMLVDQLAEDRRPTFDWRPAALFMLGLAVVTVWMLIQAVPGLPAFLQHPIWADTGRSGTISVDPGATWTTIAEVVPTALLAFVAMRVAADRRRARLVVRLIVFTSVAIGAYGLIASFVGFQQVFLLESPPYEGFLTGSFVGRSSAALYFVIGIVGALALIIAEAEERLPRRQGFVLTVLEIVGQSGFLILGCLVLVIALLDTGSRGGLVVACVAILAVAWFSVARAATRRQRVLGVVGALGLVAALVLFAISGNLLNGRLLWDVGGGGRLALYSDVLTMIWERPLLGHGAGAFISAFPLHHTLAYPGAVWNRAHDTYLQTIAELGIPGFLVLAAVIVGAFVLVARAARSRASPAPALVAAASATIAAAAHAIIDFSPQVQGVGLTLAVLLGAGVGEALRVRDEQAPERAEPVQQTVESRFSTISIAVKRPKEASAAPLDFKTPS